jgi:hypothetical protein
LINGLEDKKVYTDNDDNVTVEFEWTLSGIDEYKRAFFDGFNINVTATDRNGNVGYKNDKLDSIKDIVISAFIGIMNTIGKIISNLASLFLDFLWSVLECYINTIMTPYRLIAQPFVNELKNIQNFVDTFDLSDGLETIDGLLNAMFLGLLDKFKPFLDIMESIENLLKPILDAIKSAIQDIIDFISNLLFPAKSNSNEDDKGQNDISGGMQLSMLKGILSVIGIKLDWNNVLDGVLECEDEWALFSTFWQILACIFIGFQIPTAAAFAIGIPSATAVGTGGATTTVGTSTKVLQSVVKFAHLDISGVSQLLEGLFISILCNLVLLLLPEMDIPILLGFTLLSIYSLIETACGSAKILVKTPEPFISCAIGIANVAVIIDTVFYILNCIDRWDEIKDWFNNMFSTPIVLK